MPAGLGGTADPVIVGAGLAGLALAAALGRPSLVLERAPALREAGAGLQVTPNGMRVLQALGLRDAVEAASVAAEAVEPMDALTGRRIARFGLAGAGPYRFLHRAALLDILAGAARAAGAEVRLGTEALGVTERGVATAAGEVAAPLLLGADGLRSAVRAALDPSRAAFTGQVAWRAVVGADHPPVARVWMAPGRHAVTYPLPGGLVNLVAVREEARWSEEGWRHPDSPANLRRAFADAAPPLAAILAAVARTHRWGLFRHPVARRWQDGRRAILGDAAHPTLPFLAQGANLALEDAWTLARLLREGRLHDLERLRRPRVLRAVAAAQANARRYHLGGAARRGAHFALAAVGRLAPGAFLGRLDWLYGFDATR